MNDDQKNANNLDEEVADTASAFGSAPEDVEDIDDTMASVGLPSDENGVHELNSGEVIEQADKNQE